MYSFRKEPKGIDFFEIPRPLCLKGLHRLHLSFVFPPLREGKKQKVAEAVNLLWCFGIAGRRDGVFYRAAHSDDLQVDYMSA